MTCREKYPIKKSLCKNIKIKLWRNGTAPLNPDTEIRGYCNEIIKIAVFTHVIFFNPC